MTLEEMVVGGLYRLKETVEQEHQDHWFTFPAGLIVRLVDIDDEYHFDIPVCGMSYVFAPANLDPATEQDLLVSTVQATIEPCRLTQCKKEYHVRSSHPANRPPPEHDANP